MKTPTKIAHATIKRRFQNALDALQAQTSAATAMLHQKLAKKPQDRTALQAAQARMRACEPETRLIWNFVVSGAAGKTLPELTISDLGPLIENEMEATRLREPRATVRQSARSVDSKKRLAQVSETILKNLNNRFIPRGELH